MLLSLPSTCSNRIFSINRGAMDTTVDLILPNGIRYQQPIGLFINNEFVKSKSGKTFETIDPRWAAASHTQKMCSSDPKTVTRRRLSTSTRPMKPMLTLR